MKRNKRFCAIACLFSFASALFFYEFICSGQTEELRQREAELSEAKGRISELDGYLRLHPSLDEYEKELREREALQRKLLPDELSVGDILSDIYVFAGRAKIRLTGVSPLASTEGNGYSSQRVTISVRGRYFEVLDFLYLLEQSGCFAEVRETSGRFDGEGVFSGRIEAVVYARSIK